MTFYNHIESVRRIAIDLTNGRKWRGASDKASVFDALDAARREYMRLSEENAKLRKLANGYEALTETLCNERECDGCPFDDPEQIVCKHMSMQTCLRELEVEVD